MRVDAGTRADLDKAGDAFAELVTKHLGAMLDEVARAWKPTSHLDDLVIIRRLWLERMNDELLPALGEEYKISARQIRTTIQKARLTGAVADPFYNADKASLDYMASASNRLVGIADTTWMHVRDIVQDGLSKGLAHPKVAASIASDATLGIVQPRAGVIARTETVGARNRGSIDQMRSFGFDMQKTWLATNDHRTRPTHRDANGQRVPMELKFIVGGVEMDGPHDPTAPAREVVNCRCTLTYEIPDEQVAPDFTTTPNMWRNQYSDVVRGDSRYWNTFDDALDRQASILRSREPFTDAEFYVDNGDDWFRRTGNRNMSIFKPPKEIRLSSDVWDTDRFWDDLFTKGEDGIAWFAPVNVEITGPDYIAHHELAHYVEQTYAGNEEQVKAQLEPIAYELGGEAGVEEMEANPEAWVQAHPSQIARAVSGYAAQGVDELLSEMWAWYSLDPTGAPAFIQQSASILVEFINLGKGNALDYLKGLAGRKVRVH